MITKTSILSALALFVIGTICADSTQKNLVLAPQSVPLVLRAQPVSLENPDGRCVRNSILQMMVPMVIDALNKHLERTGVLLDDAYWMAILQKPQENHITRAELAGMALARTAIAINGWNSTLAIGTHHFNTGLELSHYALGCTQYPLLARDIADSISRLTATSMYYYQLPIDREYIKEFSAQDYLQNTLKNNTQNDYLMIDAGSSTTRAFDKHSCLGNMPLSTYNEKALPAHFTLTNKQGAVSTYEVVSFCNMERSGIPEQPSVWSRATAGLQLLTGRGVALYETFPGRHATAVVKYGNTWFTTCDTSIRQVIPETDASPSEIAQSLLSHYPGMRIIVLYKKIDNADMSHDSTNTNDVALFLKRVSPDGNIPPTENPMFYLIGALVSIAFAATCIIMFRVTRNNMYQVTTHAVGQKIARVGITLIFLATALPYCGNTVTLLHNALVSYRKKALVLKIDPKKGHASGLYSSEIESCKAVDIIAPNPETSAAKQ